MLLIDLFGSCNTPDGFFLGDVFSVKTSRIVALSLEGLTVLCVSARTTPHHRCSDANTSWVFSRWSDAHNYGVLDRGIDCTNVHFARLMAGVKGAGLNIHDISQASGSANVLGYELLPASAFCSGTAKRVARIRAVDASFNFARSSYLVSGQRRAWILRSRFARDAASLHQKWEGFLEVCSREVSCALGDSP